MRFPSMKILKHTALIPLFLGLTLSLPGCEDAGPAKPPADSQKEMEDSMKTMTLPKNPASEKAATGGEAPAGDPK